MTGRKRRFGKPFGITPVIQPPLTSAAGESQLRDPASADVPRRQLSPYTGNGIIPTGQQPQRILIGFVSRDSGSESFNLKFVRFGRQNPQALFSKPSQDASEVDEMPEILRAKSSGLELCRKRLFIGDQLVGIELHQRLVKALHPVRDKTLGNSVIQLLGLVLVIDAFPDAGGGRA